MIESPIDRDLRCARCGYNLRSLAPGARCPECGLAIADSFDAESLATAPRGWVRRLWVGLWVQSASYLLSAVSIFAEMYHSYVIDLPPAWLLILRMTPLIGLAVAVWLLTTPRQDRRVLNSTLLVRWGFAAVLLLAVVLPGVEHEAFATVLSRLGWTLFFALLIVCWIGLGCIQVRIARTLYLPRLGILIWTATIAWSIGLMVTAAFYVFKEFTERSLFNRAEPIYLLTLLVGGMLLVLSSLALAIAFTLRRPHHPFVRSHASG